MTLSSRQAGIAFRFISIDCGIADDAGYTDPNTQIAYVPDTKYIDGGVRKNIRSSLGNLYAQYQSLRSFPEGTRNCYRLSPVRPDGKYLVRAGFYHGNYDGKNSSPVFDLHIGVNLWKTSQTLVRAQGRRNYGATSQLSQLRYPEDPYDRIWFPISNVSDMYPLNTTKKVKIKTMDEFEVPTPVLSTAIRLTPTYHLPVRITANNARAGDRIYVVLHFAEIELLTSNETRKMDIYEGEYGSGDLQFGNYSPPYLLADALVSNATLYGAMYKVFIYPSASSTRPPMINALESYLVRPMDVLPTHHGDVEAMEGIKSFYKVTRNWMGDPCAPEEFRWDGVTCNYEASTPPRVIRLNMASSGLANGIPASLANLTALATLDLSNNSLTGAIPDFLAELSSLKLLILTGNQLTGTIPSRLCEKQQNDVLSIREPRLIIMMILIPLDVSISISHLIATDDHPASSTVQQRINGFFKNNAKDPDGLKRETLCFTSWGIKNITNNFAKAIGKGGFGTVYLGHLHGSQVAVKVLSHSSGQGPREFQTEALVLTRVHHRNLVSLLGYCDDEHNLSLVYEYMDNGTLRDHLSGQNGDTSALSWQQRLEVALQAAQGPPLTKKGYPFSFNFGLSRAINMDEKHTHISTVVAGTPGYLDPEYYQTNRLNEKSDVYSFGIVLLEIITGQPTFPNWPEKTHIVQCVQSRLECGDVSNIVDPGLCGDYDTNSAWKVLEIAMACTARPSMRRPTMSSVVAQLKECLAPDGASDVLDSFTMDGRIEILPMMINSGILIPTAR
ncbi:hypothetical protein Taro_045224 [Colocasia esculenta]|uniref:non-specific serine/threonine protein kinase n=1 Tax=Colocasia esculenta TaxID=4460 RepID=A0A843X6A8_COLES|nr:hypothetical protein [Colocasia esculenta]